MNRASFAHRRFYLALVTLALFAAGAGASEASVLVNKAFAPTSVQLGVTSNVTVTLSNTSTLSAANVTSLSDDVATMGGKAQLAATPNLATTCAGGTPSISGTVVSLAGGVIAAAADSTHPGTCTLTFTVVGSAVGNGINSIAAGALVTDLGSNATAASQTLQVQGAVVAVAGSATTSQFTNATATQTFTLTNPTASALTNVGFPLALSGAGTSFNVTAENSTCGGSFALSTFPATSGTVTASGLTIAAGGTCTVTVSIVDPNVATAVTVTGTLAAAAVTNSQGITNNVAATNQSKFYTGRVTLGKGFAPSTITAGATSNLTLSFGNAQTQALTSVAITDALPANMTLDPTQSATPTTNGNCSASSAPAVSGQGTGTLAVSGVSIAAAGSIGSTVTCTITVKVDTTSSFTTSTNTLLASNLSNTQSIVATANATAALTVSSSVLTASESLGPTTVARGTPVLVTLNFNNVGGAALSAGAFTDSLPQTPVAMSYYAGYAPTFTNCGSSSPAVVASGGNTIVTGSNLTIAAGITCVVKFQVTLAGGTLGAVDANLIPAANITFNSGTVSPSGAISANVTLAPAFVIRNFLGSAAGVANQPLTVQGQVFLNSTVALTDTNAVATFVLNASGAHNLKLASTPNFQFSGCGSLNASNVTVIGSGESFALSASSIAATCTLTYQVVNENTIGGASAAYVPGIDTYTSTENGSTTNSTAQAFTATFYTTSLLVNKTFTPNSIASGGTASANISLAVNGVGALAQTQANGVTFADSLPANMSFALSPNVTFGAGCQQGGQPAPSFAIAGTTISLSAISLLTTGVTQTACNVAFDVTSNFLGNTTNSIAAGGVTSTSSAVNTQPASASLSVVAGVALQKTFLAPSFAIGAVNYVRFLIVNSSGGVLASGTLGDTMPAALVLASTTAQPAAQGGDPASCGGTVTGTVGTSTFGLTGMSVAGAVDASHPGQCVQYVQVKASTSAAPGSFVNTIPAGALSIGGQSNLTGTSTPPEPLAASANAAVTQAFSQASVLQNGISTLTVTIANTGSGSAPLSAVGLSDAFPAGLVVAPTPNAATTCPNATLTAAASAATFSIAGGTLAAGATCTIVVDVTSAAANTYVNTLGPGTLTTTQGATNVTSNATLVVTAAPNVALTKAFSPATLSPHGASVLTISVANTTGGAVPLSHLALSDVLPSGLTLTATPNASTTCTGGTVTAPASGTSLSLAGGTLPAAATCTLSVTVTGALSGSYTNAIAAGNVTSFEGASNAAAATAVLTIVTPGDVAVAKAFSPPTIAPAGTSALTITVSNSATGAVALTNVALTDGLPAGTTVAALPGASTTCPNATLSAVPTGASVALGGASLAAGASCAIVVNVTGAAPGAHVNTIAAGAVSSAESATNASAATATLTIAAPGVTLAKAFAPAAIVSSATSLLTVTVANTAPAASALSALAVTDALPAGVTIAPTPNASTTCGAGTVTAIAGATSVALAGGTLAANATCTFSTSVTATAAATYTNTIAPGAVATTEGATNAASATANLVVVYAGITLGEGFAPTAIVAGATSLLTISIPNTAAGAVNLSNLALTDTLPAGISIAATPNAATTCGAGTVTAAAGGAAITLAAGILPANATCTVSVSVTGTTAAIYTNTIVTGALTSAEGVTNATPATATLTVNRAGITLSKAFVPVAIAAGGTSVLTLTIPNTAAGAAGLTGVALSDTLPPGLTIAATPNKATTCAAGTVTAAAGGTSVALAGGTLAGNATCTVSVNVTGTTAATYTNTLSSGALTTTEGVSNAAAASADLTVNLAGITLSKAFAPAAIAAGSTSVLTISIPNTAAGAAALTGVALSDSLPPGLTIAATPNKATTCTAGAVTAVAGGTSVALTGGTLAADATCTITVNVTGTAAATYTNTIATGALTTTESVSNATAATANLTVNLAGTTLNKAFAPATIVAGGTSLLTLTIPNTAAGAVALSGMQLADALPAGVTIAATPNAATTCAAGSVNATAGGTSVALTGGTLAPNATCTVSVNVTAIAAATYTNTLPSGALITTEGTSNAAPATATLTVNLAAVTLSKAFAPAAIAAGGASTLSVTVANTAPGAVALSAMQLVDALPAGLAISATPNAATTCPAATLTAVSGGTSVALTGGTLAANAACAFNVSVTGTTAATYTNTIPASAISTSQGATNGAAAMANLTIGLAGIALAKSFAPATISPGGTARLTLTIPNIGLGAVALSAVSLTDSLPAGLTIAAVPNAQTSGCGAGSVAAVAGATALALGDATIAAGTTCTVAVGVTASLPGAYINTIPAAALQSAQGATNAMAATATLTAASAVDVAITNAFVGASIVPGATSTLTITLANVATNAVALSNLTLVNALPANVTVAATPGAATTCLGGIATATPGGSSIALGNGSLGAGATCRLVVTVTSTTPGSYTDTVAAHALASAQGATNAVAAAATLAVSSEPNVALTKSFAPASPSAGTTSTLTIAIANTANDAIALSGLALRDALPTGLKIAAPPGVATTCRAGSVAATAGGSSITLTGATLAAQATCTLTVAVTAASVGTYVNTLGPGALVSAQGATNGEAAVATLTAGTPRSVTLTSAFMPTSIVPGATAIFTVRIANTASNAVALSDVTLADSLPANVTVASVPGATTTCGTGTASATAGGSALTLTGGTLAPGASCLLSVTVTAMVPGTYLDTIPSAAASSAQGATNPLAAGATLTVARAPDITLALTLSPTTIAPHAMSQLTVTLTNSAAAAVALSSLALVDALPAGVAVAATPAAATTCGTGRVTAPAAATTVTLGGGSLAAHASCTIVVNVTGATVGTYLDTIAAGAIRSLQAATNAAAANATLAIAAPKLTVVKTSNPQGASVAPGQKITYAISLTNAGLAAETAAKLSDVLKNATLVPGSVRVAGVAASDRIVTGGAPLGDVPAASTVAITYAAIVNANVTPGTAVSNDVTVGGDQPCVGAGCHATSQADTVGAPSLAVTLTIDGKKSVVVTPGQTVTFGIVVRNSGSVAASDASLTDAVPIGVTPIPGSVSFDGFADARAMVARRAAVARAGTPVPTATFDGQDVTIPVGTVEPGAAVSLSFRGVVGKATGIALVNTVTIAATNVPKSVLSNPVVATMPGGAIAVTKTAGATAVSVGDRVDYSITASGATGVSFGAATVVDTLPAYEAYAPGTARVNGKALEPAIQGHRLSWTLPNMRTTITIVYATVVAAGVQPNTTLSNTVDVSAVAAGGATADTGTASASVIVVGNSFGACFPLTGRVYVDVNGTGRFGVGDRGVGGVAIYLSTGESVTTDREGRYDFPCIRPGMHALRLDETTLPGGLAAFSDHSIDSERSTRRLVHRTFDDTIVQDVNFAIASPAPLAPASK